MKVVILRGDGVWISGSWEVAWLMIREAVGTNDAFTTGYRNGDAIGADAGFDAICISARAQLSERLVDEARKRDEKEQNSAEFRCNSHKCNLDWPTLRAG